MTHETRFVNNIRTLSTASNDDVASATSVKGKFKFVDSIKRCKHSRGTVFSNLKWLHTCWPHVAVEFRFDGHIMRLMVIYVLTDEESSLRKYVCCTHSLSAVSHCMRAALISIFTIKSKRKNCRQSRLVGLSRDSDSPTTLSHQPEFSLFGPVQQLSS